MKRVYSSVGRAFGRRFESCYTQTEDKNENVKILNKEINTSETVIKLENDLLYLINTCIMIIIIQKKVQVILQQLSGKAFGC